MDHHWEEKPKKKKVTALNSVSKAKKQCNFGSGWLTAGNLKTKTTKSIPLLQPEHGVCRHNGPKRSQVQDCCLNEKMVVMPFCLNGSCCSLGCVDVASY